MKIKNFNAFLRKSQFFIILIFWFISLLQKISKNSNSKAKTSNRGLSGHVVEPSRFHFTTLGDGFKFRHGNRYFLNFYKPPKK